MNCRVLEKIRSNEAKEEEDKKNKSVNITQGEVDANKGKQKQNENNQRMERNSEGNERTITKAIRICKTRSRINKMDHRKEKETGKQQAPESENERQPDGHIAAENNNNQLNYNGTKQKNDVSPNSSEEKVENTYPNEELVEKEQPRINLISKSTILPTKIKNQKPLQLAVELNSEQVIDQPPRPPDNNLKDIINCRKDKDLTASTSTISNREKEGSQAQRENTQYKDDDTAYTRGRSKKRRRAKRSKPKTRSPSKKREQKQNKNPSASIPLSVLFFGILGE
ncbi:hypothetical protein KY290_024428 [Solanum tuberosum]|uniref:Uncharacterized protein n=1 Tax=Solanum tuberosum TaxID=4113 RepID=A0ABQ7UQM5_SOLTU|nr:hypothetical protein KY290_024428 [Solanum tuberosum]